MIACMHSSQKSFSMSFFGRQEITLFYSIINNLWYHPYINTKLSIAIAVGATLLIGSISSSSCQTSGQQAFAQGQPQQQGDSLVLQNTTTSIQDPVPGHSGPQLALVAPPREDGKIWSGVVTFTASKPVDVVVLHPYNKPQIVTTNQVTICWNGISIPYYNRRTVKY